MDREIMVSVCMITYNHQRFIRQAIDSVLMQKVNFKYEIVISDDCSPDNTQDIIQEYAEKYPDIIKTILRKNNIGTVYNSYNVKLLCKGKYIAVLEGDDYWTDENKLQIQVNFLETHLDCFSVAHRNEIVDINGIHQSYNLNGQKLDRYFKKEDAMNYKAELFHPNSIMYKNFFYDSKDKYVIFRDSNKYGSHSLLVFFLATMSDIYIMERSMSAWRRVVEPEGTNYASFAARNPVETDSNLFVMYKNYRDYFKNEYDFNYVVRERFIICISRILKSDIEKYNKIKKIKKYFKYLRLNDILMLPIVIIQLVIKRITRKYIDEK